MLSHHHQQPQRREHGQPDGRVLGHVDVSTPVHAPGGVPGHGVRSTEDDQRRNSRDTKGETLSPFAVLARTVLVVLRARNGSSQPHLQDGDAQQQPLHLVQVGEHELSLAE